MTAELTTLQVARKIADAVIEAYERAGPAPRNRDASDATDPATQAVLRVLHETGTWLSKWESELPADTAEPDDEPHPVLR